MNYTNIFMSGEEPKEMLRKLGVCNKFKIK